MVRKDKLIRRLRSRPKDFTFDELETLLGWLGYYRHDKGHSSGSRVIFVSKHHRSIILHKPHPGNIMKQYQLKQLIEHLEKEKLI